MSEAPETSPGTALTANVSPLPAKAPREYRVVESRLGIMDTARFEHIGRVATVLARAGFLPQSLTHAKNASGEMAELPFDVIQARAFLIANQADLIGIDPNALAQCTSFVHGKLMYEGKLVHALISEKLGIDLQYEFGTYIAAKRDITEGMPECVDDQGLGVRVSGTLPGEREPRWIAGSVAMWHKGDRSPWGAATAWPRQLRYMGAREWCRAYKPSLLLGILTDDEVDEYELGRQAGQIAAPAPQPLHAGFDDMRPATMLEGPAKPRAARTARKPARDPLGTPLETVDAETGEVLDAALDGDNLPAEVLGEAGNAPISQAAPTATASAPPAVSAPVSSASATPASAASPKAAAASSRKASSAKPAASSPAEPEPEPEDVIADGYPDEDEIYHLNGDEWHPETGRRDTYKQGLPFSSASRQGGYRIFEDHAPEHGDGPAPGAYEAAEAPPADAAAAGEDDMAPEFTAYIDAVEEATSWAAVKQAMASFYNTEVFKAMKPAQQNKVRANTWDVLQENSRDQKLADLPQPGQDLSAFRLWIEWASSPDIIDGTLAGLTQRGAFEGKDDRFVAAIRGAAETRCAALRG